ncbi:unnamed protein product [Mytilus coruscus]|uniref:Uncharacterized protein n=1 Tax=Mytilus coruscus TaxID=42192 RepID=A0A6J8CP45_MYTCO|nr:unnamed protein product [Mytilus coruscus]
MDNCIFCYKLIENGELTVKLGKKGYDNINKISSDRQQEILTVLTLQFTIIADVITLTLDRRDRKRNVIIISVNTDGLDRPCMHIFRHDNEAHGYDITCVTSCIFSVYSRHQERLLELGYPGAKAALKDDAIPDIPVVVDAEKGPSSPKKPRSAFEKRQKRQVLEEAFNDSLDKFLDSIDIETESSPTHDSMDNREEEEIPGDIQKNIRDNCF